MQLANFSDEAGKQIYRHLRNWQVITLFIIDHKLIHVYPVHSLTTYLYKTNFNIIFPFYLDLLSGPPFF